MIGIRPSQFGHSGHSSRRFTRGGFRKPANLEGIRHHVLVANGDDDRMVPTSNSFDLAHRLPNATLRIYPDAGHGGVFQFHERFVGEALVVPGSRYLKSPPIGPRSPHKEHAMTSLAGQTVLVTGANRGMGREYIGPTARPWGHQGLRGRPRPRDGRRHGPPGDPAAARRHRRGVRRLRRAKAASDVSVLINNAGISRATSVLDADTSALREELEANHSAAGNGIDVRRSDRRAVRCHRQRRVDPRVDASRGELRGVQGGNAERHGLDAHSNSHRAACRWWASTVGLVDTDMAKFTDYPKSDPFRCHPARCSTASRPVLTRSSPTR